MKAMFHSPIKFSDSKSHRGPTAGLQVQNAGIGASISRGIIGYLRLEANAERVECLAELL